jgi:hypothetical protein
MLTLLENLPKLLKLIGGAQSGLVLLNPLLETLPERQKEESRQSYLKTLQAIVVSMSRDVDGQRLSEETLTAKIILYSEGSSQERIAAAQLVTHLSIYVSQERQLEWKGYLIKIIEESKDT